MIRDTPDWLPAGQLPTACYLREGFKALGFTFGEPDPSNPLFAPADLPAGWTKAGTVHPRAAVLLDEYGRERARLWYWGAEGDRGALMSLKTLIWYVGYCADNGEPIIPDDTWATREAVADALLFLADNADEEYEFESTHGDTFGVAEDQRVKAERYRSLLADWTTP